MTQAVAVGLSPFFGGSLRRNKGVMNAISGPASFAAIQGTWTLGYLNPNSWFRADFEYSVTLGATHATIAGLDAWSLLNTVRTPVGDWREIRSWPFGTPLNRYIYTGPLTNFLGNAPCGFIIEVKRGAPPPGYGSNRVRFSSNLLTADIDLDTGAVVGGSYETCEVLALGLTPDDGYRVILRGTYAVVGSGASIGLLNNGSTTYTDAPGDGHFFARNPDIDQYRVERWSSMTDWSLYFEQLDPVKQYVYWTNQHGRTLASSLESYMTGSAGVSALVNGVAQPFTIAASVHRLTAFPDPRLLSFTHSLSAHEICVSFPDPAPRSRFYRVASTGLALLDYPVSSPFSGALVHRFDGLNLRSRINGVDAPAVAVPPGSVCNIDGVTLGYPASGSTCRLAYVNEVTINSRSWSDTESAAADIHLRSKWGYP